MSSILSPLQQGYLEIYVNNATLVPSFWEFSNFQTHHEKNSLFSSKFPDLRFSRTYASLCNFNSSFVLYTNIFSIIN